MRYRSRVSCSSVSGRTWRDLADDQQVRVQRREEQPRTPARAGTSSEGSLQNTSLNPTSRKNRIDDEEAGQGREQEQERHDRADHDDRPAAIRSWLRTVAVATNSFTPGSADAGGRRASVTGPRMVGNLSPGLDERVVEGRDRTTSLPCDSSEARARFCSGTKKTLGTGAPSACRQLVRRYHRWPHALAREDHPSAGDRPSVGEVAGRQEVVEAQRQHQSTRWAADAPLEIRCRTGTRRPA